MNGDGSIANHIHLQSSIATLFVALTFNFQLPTHMPLFPPPPNLVPPATKAQQQFDAGKYHETISYCNQELAALAKQLKSPNKKLPQEAAADSPEFQYYALTQICANALG